MTAIPPNWLGSAAQTQGAAQRRATEKAHEGASQVEGGGTFADRLQDVIEASDRDSQVYSDAEGQGGQGRPDDGGPEEEQKKTASASDDEDQPSGRLDIEA